MPSEIKLSGIAHFVAWILSLTGDPVRVLAMFNTTIRYDLLFS